MSPLIFALTLEPLLNKIRLNSAIIHFTVGPTEHKLSAYPDDDLFYVSDPLISLPNIMAELDWTLICCSIFKSNYSKSEILSLNVPLGLRTQLQAFFSPLPGARLRKKYLGVYLPTSCSQLYTFNYVLLLSTIRADLKSWDHTSFSWMGRVHFKNARVAWNSFLPANSLLRPLFSTLNSLFFSIYLEWQKPSFGSPHYTTS